MASGASWIFAGVILTAKTGIDYRKLRKGELSEEKFYNNAKINSVSAAGGIVGGASGMAAGFALGSLILPGVGSVVGALIGGFSGTWAGEVVSVKAY